MRAYNIILIGCGNMGGALLSSWLESDMIQKCQILDPNDYPIDSKHKKILFHVKQAQMLDFTNIDMVILAVKPQILDDVCQTIAPFCDGSFPVLSIAAGKSIATLTNHLNANTPLIRAMPNTPASVKMGFTALFANHQTTNDQKDIATNLFTTCGTTQWINDEKLMDVVTAVSGSGPAYLFYFIEALTNAAIKNGMSADMAEIAARQTIIGAAALANHENATTPQTLRENVTSKGGTTQAGLEVLMNEDFADILNNTIAAAKKRSEELAD